MIEKVTQTNSDTCSICQKTNYIEIRKINDSVGNVPLSAMHAFTVLLMFDASKGRVPLSRKRFTRLDSIDLFDTGESENASLNSFWQVK
jgi:hypothetical protein